MEEEDEFTAEYEGVAELNPDGTRLDGKPLSVRLFPEGRRGRPRKFPEAGAEVIPGRRGTGRFLRPAVGSVGTLGDEPTGDDSNHLLWRYGL